MRKTTISCDGCKSPCPQQNPNGVLDRSWLELHVTTGIVAHMDVAFCMACKDDGPRVYRTVMRRLAEEERKIQEMRAAIKREQQDGAG